MFRFRIFITIFCFSVWILPLGVFIKPSQEQLACNGQRAICLCSHLMAKNKLAAQGKAVIAVKGNNLNKDSAPGLSKVFSKDDFKKDSSLLSFHGWSTATSTYVLLYSKSIEPVPKV